MPTIRGLPARLARMLLATLLLLLPTLVLLEAGARMLAGVLGLSPYMRYDATTGWTAIEGAVKNHRDRGGQFDVTYVINEHGFRGPAYPQARSPGVYRIVVVGDSTAFGWGVSWEQTFAGILDHELPDTEVINVALSGFGLDQSLLRFRDSGAAFAPDLVIIQSTPNDFEEIMYPFFNQKPKPQFQRTADDRLRLTNVPVRGDSIEAQRFYDLSVPVPFKEWLGWNSYAFNAINEFFHGMWRSEPHRLPEGREKINTDSVWMYNAILRLHEAEIRATGAQGILVHTIRQVSGTGQVEGGELRVLDLHPAFLEGGSGDTSSYFFKDGYHWSVLGHRLVADELQGAIRALQAETVTGVAADAAAGPPGSAGSDESIRPAASPE